MIADLMTVDPNSQTIAFLRARAERYRALARVARLPFAAQMLERLAEQFEGEAARLASGGKAVTVAA